MRRALSACAVIAMATLAPLAAPAGAAIPSPTQCEAQSIHQVLLTSPVLLEVGLLGTSTGYNELWVCVGTKGGATDGVAYQAYTVRAHPGGSGLASCTPSGDFTGVGTTFVPATGSAGLLADAGVATTPQLCVSGTTFRLTIPVRLCLGVPCPVDTAPGVGQTGLIVGTFGLAAPPSGTPTGAGIQVYGFYLWVDGVQITFGPSQYDAAGVNLGAVTAPTNGTVVCGPLNLVCIPGAAGVYYNGGPILGIALTGVGTTYVTIPGGARCVPVFTVAPNPPAC